MVLVLVLVLLFGDYLTLLGFLVSASHVPDMFLDGHEGPPVGKVRGGGALLLGDVYLPDCDLLGSLDAQGLLEAGSGGFVGFFFGR